MEAMQKRKMRIVAAIHFALTAFFGFCLARAFGPFSGPAERWAWVSAWRNLLENIFLFFQPQFAVLNWIEKLSIVKALPFTFPIWLSLFLVLLSIPIWSICFSWLFVKFDNWLNHFPILGRKVF